MHDKQKGPAPNHSQGVPALFAVLVDPVLDEQHVRVFEHAGGNLEIQPVLPAVGLTLGRVPFKPPHFVIHIV